MGGKAKPSWLPNRYKIYANIKNGFIQKAVFPSKETMIFMVRVVQDGHQKPRQDRTGQDRTGQVKTGQNGCGFWWIFKGQVETEKLFHPSKVTHGDARRGMQSMPRPGQAEQGQGKARAAFSAGGGPAAGTPRSYKDGSPGPHWNPMPHGTPGNPGGRFLLFF